MLDIFDISKYKKCREKQYKSYFCLPEQGAYVINKLDKTEEWIKIGRRSFISKSNMDRLQSSNYDAYTFIQQNGKVIDNKSFVISGVTGELDLISFGELSNKFTFVDGSPITKESIMRLMHGRKSFNWVAIVSKTIMRAIAYPVKSSYVDKININNRVCSINIPGVDHGRGDFIVCYIDNAGNPIQSTLRVVNGIEFKEKFDNRGWTELLSTKEVDIEMPKQLVNFNDTNTYENNAVSNKVNSFAGNQISDVIEKILQWCKKTIHNDIKWEYKRIENKFTVSSGVIKQYRQDNNCTHIASTIEVKEDVIVFKTYNISANSKNKALEFSIAIDENIENNLIENRFIYFGIIGYIRGDATGVFKTTSPLNKAEYDGIERYTIASGGPNRLCRGMPDANKGELDGETRADNARCIIQVDSAMEKSVIANEVTLFRGMPSCDAYKFSNSTAETYHSATVQNTAFSSTSLNLHATIMFALPRGEKDGVIQIIQNNIGVNAIYIGNIAGWEEQYEVLVDRNYDLKNDGFLLEIKTNKGRVSIYKSHFVAHRPLSPIGSKLLENFGIYNYNNWGKTEVSNHLMDNIMHEAFNILRNEGLSNIQYMKDVPSLDAQGGKGAPNSYIVVDTLNKDRRTGQSQDIVYALRQDAGENRLLTYIVQGDKNNLRSYWSDINRNNGKTDYNFKWSNYSSYNITDRMLMQFPQGYAIVSNNPTAEEIASAIYKNIVYRDDVMLFPLLDIGRYFGQVMQQYIVQEGFVIKQGFRIDRIGKEDEPQDGYVPVKFRIDGDNDDDLLLQINFRRTRDNMLEVTYRGRSNNNKVDESKRYVYNEFNMDIANDLAHKVLYTFVSKLKLSCMSKMDRFIDMYCIKYGYTSIKVQCAVDKVDESDFRKKYRIVKANEFYNILGIKNSSGQFKVLISNGVSKGTMDFDYTNSMLDIARIFKSVLDGLNTSTNNEEV